MSSIKLTGDTSGEITISAPAVAGTNTLTLPAITGTTVVLDSWTITESGGVLYFATGGTNKMKLDASGNLTCVGDVTAFGTV
tara:strand:- start:1047 stop:1292 length:246 start_codon:yes stop_codon:yes gene_type:complete